MAHLDVNPADLLRAADNYAELQLRAAAIGPKAVEEVQRIIATHGPMGYPLAVGVVAGLARRQAALDAKAANFGQYSQRFTEHAAAYRDQDLQGARDYAAPAATMLDLGGPGHIPPPEGRVICTEINAGGFGCSEFLPGGMIFHWLSPVDLTGHWPDFP
ncbi:Protein of unknown function (DUF2580) (plasmid) [Mycobacterium sp. JS623]|uniref:type VII secretion target n=1 Tax=Mycobacterium sp. JS623 TaxID=212767 RepID=UPI0002A5A897|nr:type VII secretion target [Mycobacterium sp. JS623]AGB27277.1 Protein of unknown function (DUF2580) [Mycobacterium sp. JS623]